MYTCVFIRLPEGARPGVRETGEHTLRLLDEALPALREGGNVWEPCRRSMQPVWGLEQARGEHPGCQDGCIAAVSGTGQALGGDKGRYISVQSDGVSSRAWSRCPPYPYALFWAACSLLCVVISPNHTP